MRLAVGRRRLPCSEHNPGELQIRSAGLIQVCPDGINYPLLPGRRRDGRNGTGSGFQAAKIRTHSRACEMSVMAGKAGAAHQRPTSHLHDRRHRGSQQQWYAYRYRGAVGLFTGRSAPSPSHTQTISVLTTSAS